MVQSIDYAALAPALAAAIGALLVVLADLAGAGRRALDGLTLLTAGTGLATVFLLAAEGASRRTFCLSGGGCSYVADGFTLLIQGLVLAAAAIVVLLSSPVLTGDRLPTAEYHFLLLCAVTGAVTLGAARDLITLVVALEVVSLPVFALTAFPGRRPGGAAGRVAGEAALKLFLFSVVSTAVTLYGIALLYGVTGELQLDRLAAALARAGPGEPVAAVLTIAGFAFKVAAVPFHFWAPDVYQGAPVPVAAFLSVVSKSAGFAGLILVLAVGLRPYAETWSVLLGVLAATTMTWGNLVALRQRHAVRLLAWSSVAQSGYILAPLAIAHREPSLAVQATLVYLVIYAAMNLGAFGVVTAVSRRYARNELEDYRGLARSAPLAAAALGFFLICLAGLPPGLAGLFAKIAVFRAVVLGGAGWLAVILAINTVIGLYYYLAWAVRMLGVRAGEPRLAVPFPLGVATAVAAVVTVGLSVAPAGVFGLVPLALPLTP
ncbi:MAG: NADH-quinone oxidoreductase subunit N [Streptosporangiales bacterium]|nr:NADH-quinone oxidoreductase subunit N [Streptosporangiales bacterium]